MSTPDRAARSAPARPEGKPRRIRRKPPVPFGPPVYAETVEATKIHPIELLEQFTTEFAEYRELVVTLRKRNAQ
jgi:hypothetical protein